MIDTFIQALPAWPVLLVLGFFSLAAGLLRGFSGFGAGLLMAPGFSLFLSPVDVLVIILVLNFVTTVQVLPEALPHVDWPLTMRLFIPAIFGIPLGLSLLHWVDPVIMRRTVAGIVIVLALVMLAGWHYRGRRGRLQDTLTGLLSGCMTGIASIGGPPLVLYLLSDKTLAPAVFRAINIVIFLGGQLVAFIPLTLSGSFTGTQGVYILALLPVYVVANALGVWLYRWSMGKHQAQVRRASLIALLAVGLVVIVV